jgi:hypothetical protein
VNFRGALLTGSVFILIACIGQISFAEDLDKILSDAKAALQNSSENAKEPVEAKPHKTIVKKSVQKSKPAASPDEVYTSTPLTGDEAHEVLNIDVRALSHEQEPQDPRFIAYFSGGIFTARPSFSLYKDDDSFSLHGPAQLSGGTMALSTSWSVSRIKLLVKGGAGIYSGSGDVVRTGVENTEGTYDFYIVPINLSAGVGIELFKRLNVAATYGPSLDLITQKGNGQVDTLSGAFSADEFDLSVGTPFGHGWEGQFDWIQNAIFNQNIKGQGFVLGLGYRISG